MQEALLDAWDDIRLLRAPDRCDAWLNRLLVRACYRVARRDRAHASRIRQIAPDRETTDDGFMTDEGLVVTSPSVVEIVGPVHLTGTAACEGSTGSAPGAGGAPSSSPHGSRATDFVHSCTLSADDPRLSGTLAIPAMSSNGRGAPANVTGTARIENPWARSKDHSPARSPRTAGGSRPTSR